MFIILEVEVCYEEKKDKSNRMWQEDQLCARCRQQKDEPLARRTRNEISLRNTPFGKRLRWLTVLGLHLQSRGQSFELQTEDFDMILLVV